MRMQLHSRVVWIEKGLTRAAALKVALKKLRGFDFRGFTYDKKTGKAVFV